MSNDIDNQRQLFSTVLPALPQAPAGLREAALARFADGGGFPTTKQEDWKYTNLSRLAELDLPVAAPGLPGAAEHQRVADLCAAGSDAVRLVFVNGAFDAAASTSVADTGLSVLSMADALAERSGAVAAHLDALAGLERSSLVALNTAFLGAGAFLQIDADTDVARPIHLVFATHSGNGGGAYHLRCLISAGRGARADVIEHHIGLDDGAYWNNCATDIIAGEGANLSHVKIQRESPAAYHTADISAVQDTNSSLHSVSIALGARLNRNDIRIRLASPGAHCALDGLYMLDGQQLVDHHTLVDHAAPRCNSAELYKGVLGGASTGIFNGKVIVRAEGQRTDAQQLNKNLLLSGDATINTKPQLEIFADDVKCGHGATTGRLEEDAIFYLRARGIDESSARALLTFAFANEVVDRVPIAELREDLATSVEQRLRDISGGEHR